MGLKSELFSLGNSLNAILLQLISKHSIDISYFLKYEILQTGRQGASSVHMTKHFYDVRLHDLVYKTSIYMTQLLHDTWLHDKHVHEIHLNDKSIENMTEQNHDTH